MKLWKKGLCFLLAMILVTGVFPMTGLALYDTSGNEYVISKKMPSGKTGKNMNISFDLYNASGSDINNIGIGLSPDVNLFDDEVEITDGYVFPFEVTEGTFHVKRVGSLKSGSHKSVSITARVRRDLPEGYYYVPIKVYDDNGGQLADEYVNIWISKSTTDSTNESDDDDEIFDFVLGENQSTPDGVYPNVMNFSVNMRNNSHATAYRVTASLVLDPDNKKYPFEINDANYDRFFDKISVGETVQLPYSMAIQADTYTGYYPITVKIQFWDSSSGGSLKEAEEIFYVRVHNKEKEDDLNEFNANDREKARMVVDSFQTVPETIIAGDEFELILKMKNASTSIPANNILLSFESEKVSDSAVFTTESGSSSVAMDALGSGAVKEVRMKMQSKPGIDQRSYALTVKAKFDSPKFKNAEESMVIDIPIKQIARLSTGTFEVMPDSIEAGQESNIMFGINNTGRVMLYNVTVSFEADSVQKNEAYVGNIKPGESGNVDCMLTGIAPTSDDGKIRVMISYEDENGEVSTVEKELMLNVTEPQPEWDDPVPDDFDMDTAEVSSPFQKYKMQILFGAGAVAVLLVSVTVTVIIRRKKKLRSLDEDIDDEIS